MEQKNNMILSVAVVAIIIAVMVITSSIQNLTNEQNVKNPEIKFNAPDIEIGTPDITLSDKNVQTYTLNPPLSTDTNAVKATKKIKALRLDSGRTINLFGPIANNAHQAAAMIRTMSSISKDPIYLVLYSPGGSVIDGAALISTMQASIAPVYTICYSFCASMAAMIHQYVVQRYMTDRSILMFHPASFGTSGEVDKVFSQTRTIQRYINKIEMEVS